MIDQQTRRRIGRVGLTAIDEEKCCPGYVLYCSALDGRTAHIIDVHGREVHRWKLPYPPAFWSYLLPNGNLFSMGRIETDDLVVTPNWIERGGVLYEMDWDGKIVWEHRDPFQHHDGRRLPSGGAIYLTVKRMPDELARMVQGGIAGSESHGMWSDVVVEVDSDGNRVWQWDAADHLNVETDTLPPNVPRHEWSHGNTVVPLDEERIMVSFRHLSIVAIIDKSTGELIWKLDRSVLSGQHDPTYLPNGNVLIFDNGIFRTTTHATYSRVIEIDLESKDVVWEYRDTPAANFYSPFVGGARRLPNGNTLITEGWFGRMFQVTHDKEVVWEYINPYFESVSYFGPALFNSVFRASHYAEGEIPGLE